MGQEMSKCKTSTRRGQPNPVYKETFVFQVALFQLSDVTLILSVYNKRSMKRKEMIGWISLGLNSSGEEELRHWSAMKESKGQQVCRWHALLESWGRWLSAQHCRGFPITLRGAVPWRVLFNTLPWCFTSKTVQCWAEGKGALSLVEQARVRNQETCVLLFSSPPEIELHTFYLNLIFLVKELGILWRLWL